MIVTHPTYSRSRVAAWVLYDVANSSFTTLIVTFIYSTYFVKYMSGTGQDLTHGGAVPVALGPTRVAS